MSDREELAALRRMAELEARSGGAPAAPVAPAQVPEQPKAQERNLPYEMLKGYMQGGPVGAAMGGFNHGVTTLNNLISEGAYNAGGKVQEAATGAGMSPEVAGGAGYATNVGLQAIPALLGGGIGSKVGGLVEGLGERLMRSALKPSAKAMESGAGDRAVRTMLDEGANVTQGGIQQLLSKEAGLATQEKSALAGSSDILSKQQIADALAGTEKKFTSQVDPMGDIAAIRAIKTRFLNHPSIQADDIPIQLAQELKQGTYKILGDKAYTGELKGADAEAQKALARALREGIESKVPAVAPINAERSDLINAIKIATRRDAVAGNKNPAGGFPMLAHSPAAALAMMADRSELIKSLLARALYSGGKPISTGVGATAGGLYGMANDNK